MPKRILSGKVIKKSGDKTVSVLVTRQTTHPIYKKIIRVSKKYLAHDADNTIAVGENVKIQETFEKMEVLSKNGLSIKIDLSFRYNPVPNEIGYLHDNIGKDYLESIIKPEIRSVTREVIGNYLPSKLRSSINCLSYSLRLLLKLHHFFVFFFGVILSKFILNFNV